MKRSIARGRKLQLGAAALVGCAFLAQPGPAKATLFCNVIPTHAGVAPLRAGPSATARLIARMHRGDEVLVRDDLEAKNGWVFVTWWKGGRFKVKGSPGRDPSNGEGWVMESQLSDECG